MKQRVLDGLTPAPPALRGGRAGSSTCSPPCFVAPVNRPCCASVLRCDQPPAVLAPGPGLFSVRNNVGWSAEVMNVEYAFLFDAALGRRPYVHEAEGSLLLRCNASLVGRGGVRVVASIPALPPAASASWRWDNLTLGGADTLVLDLGAAELPALVNADLRVVISGYLDGGTSPRAATTANVTKWRRFMRAPPRPGGGGAAAVVAQVDHERRGLLLDGVPEPTAPYMYSAYSTYTIVHTQYRPCPRVQVLRAARAVLLRPHPLQVHGPSSA